MSMMKPGFFILSTAVSIIFYCVYSEYKDSLKNNIFAQSPVKPLFRPFFRPVRLFSKIRMVQTATFVPK
jgi:hypothetical protein